MKMIRRVPAPSTVAFLPLVMLAVTEAGAERPWESAMQAFEEQDAASAPEPGGVVFVGSSSIRRWDLDASFGSGSPTRLDGPLLNRGFGGSHLIHSVEMVDLLILKHQPRVVVVYAGDNDVKAGKSAERVADDFGSLVAAVREELPRATIAYIGIKPSLARWALAETMRDANRRIAGRCGNDPNLVFIDIWAPMLDAEGLPRRELFVEDGLHLSKAGYRVWAGAVHRAVAGR